MANVPASQIAQIRPANTSATSLIAVGSAGPEIELTRVMVCNTSGTSQTFRLFHDNDGSTYDETTALAWDKSIASGGYEIFEAQSEGSGLVVSKTGNIGCRSSATSALTFTAYGVVRVGR